MAWLTPTENGAYMLQLQEKRTTAEANCENCKHGERQHFGAIKCHRKQDWFKAMQGEGCLRWTPR